MAEDKKEAAQNTVDAARIEALEAKVAVLEALVPELQKTIETLQAAQVTPEEPKKKKKAELTKTPFKVGKESYVLRVAQFKLPENGVHILYTEKDVLENKELQAKLVDGKYFGIIKPVK